MTQTANLFLVEFNGLCVLYGIDPCLALESEKVRQAIKARSWAAIREALETEF